MPSLNIDAGEQENFWSQKEGVVPLVDYPEALKTGLRSLKNIGI